MLKVVPLKSAMVDISVLALLTPVLCPFKPRVQGPVTWADGRVDRLPNKQPQISIA